MLGIPNPAHAEYDPEAPNPLIAPASCPLPEERGPRLQNRHRVRLKPGSNTAGIYGADEAFEPFHCSYELSREYQPRFEASGLRIVGVGDEGEARIVELAGDRFFIGTLFLPQMRSVSDGPHPLIRTFVEATAAKRAHI